jgi:DNA mismatch repair ATPase MutL
MLMQVWLNPCMRASGNDVLDISAGVLAATSSSLSPELVTKESLQHLTVLGQVDSKFIAVVASGVLLLVDQVSTTPKTIMQLLNKFLSFSAVSLFTFVVTYFLRVCFNVHLGYCCNVASGCLEG